MKLPGIRHKLTRASTVSLLILPCLVSRGASTTAAETAVILSPFEVNTSRDDGFAATNSLAGGRLATDLKDTPASYSVMTREFIDALQLTNLVEAAVWGVNMTEYIDNGFDDVYGYGANRFINFRGAGANNGQRNFFPFNLNADSYNLDRLDLGRGPNSILFGSGSFGGSTNAVTKRALTARDITTFRVTAGSWDNYRSTVDVNRAHSSRQMGVRVNAVAQDSGSWLDRGYEKKVAATISGTCRITAQTQITVELERGRIEKTAPTTTLNDSFAGWDGITTYDTRLTTLPANANALGVTRESAAEYIWAPGLNAGAVMNYGLMARTQGAAASAQVPVGGRLVVGPITAIASAPFRETINLPADIYDRALQGSKLTIPGRAFTMAADGPQNLNLYNSYSCFVNQQIGRNLFAELGFNYTSQANDLYWFSVRGVNNIKIDINRKQPDGSANPKFLTPYGEAGHYWRDIANQYYNTRFSLAYVLTETRFGGYKFNLNAADARQETSDFFNVFSLTRNADARSWFNDSILYRFYTDDTRRPLPTPPSVKLIDPIAGTTTNVGSSWARDFSSAQYANLQHLTQRYYVGSVNARLWRNRLNLLGAMRRDEYSTYVENGHARGDYPLGWDGFTPLYKPAAPEDYGTMTYVPKDASGNATGAAVLAETRPRDTSGNRLPQYANDRFRSDYNAPVRKGSIITQSLGGVVHLTPWLSLSANEAETFNPAGWVKTINNELQQPTASKGYDYGLRFYLFDQRVTLNLTRYESKEDHSPTSNRGVLGGVSFDTEINRILQANRIGDLSSSSRNIRGVVDVPTNYNDFRQREATGHEVDLTANFNRAWRISANCGLPRAYQLDALSETRAWLAQNDAVLRQIMKDAGALIDSANVASIDTSVNINQRSPDVSNAVNGWNAIQKGLGSYSEQKQLLSGLSKYSANIFLDHTTQSGPLKGLRLGGGVNFRGPRIIGFRGNDTIPDPADRTKAIDDPSVDANTPVYADSYYLVTVTAGHRWRLRGNRSLAVNLRIANLLDHDRPIYSTTNLRPINGDITSAARMSTPINYGWTSPRSFSLTTTVEF